MSGSATDAGLPTDAWHRAVAAPNDRPAACLDARELPPPEPLRLTLERLSDLGETVLLQVNDREPQLLYPKLADRGFEYDTVTVEEGVVTAIWR